jgi:hypothetical protein
MVIGRHLVGMNRRTLLLITVAALALFAGWSSRAGYNAQEFLTSGALTRSLSVVYAAQMFLWSQLWSYTRGLYDGATDRVMLQVAMTGALTFSVPVLWAFYQELRDLRSRRETSLMDIALKEQSKTGSMATVRNTLNQAGVLAIVGLMILPLLPRPLNLMGVLIVIAWFIRIYERLESSKLLDSKIVESMLGKEDAKKLAEVFRTVWDEELEYLNSQLLPEDAALYSVFTKRIKEVLDTGDVAATLNLLRPFIAYSEKADPNPLYPRTILEVRGAVWDHFKPSVIEGDNAADWPWRNLSNLLDTALIHIQETSLKNYDAFEYLPALSDHIENFAGNEQSRYRQRLIHLIAKNFFVNAAKSPTEQRIWQDFPWHITNGKLVYRMETLTGVWWYEFLEFFFSKIRSDEIDYVEDELNSVCGGLFSECDPWTFACLQTFSYFAFFRSDEPPKSVPFSGYRHYRMYGSTENRQEAEDRTYEFFDDIEVYSLTDYAKEWMERHQGKRDEGSIFWRSVIDKYLQHATKRKGHVKTEAVWPS